MDIKFLKKLSDNPVKKGINFNFPIKSISVLEIEQLEQLYNNGNSFPKALRELLFLAGDDCYVLDYGLNDSQQKMQEESRDYLTENGLSINRPFYVIDVYNAGDQFLFVYLDESEDDPYVYCAFLASNPNVNFLTNLESKLSSYINKGVEKVKNGYNPF